MQGGAMMLELDRIICGDCLEVLRTMPSESVDCCVTSPPYYGSKVLFSMADILQIVARNSKGQFVKGSRNSPNTEFKSGQHWREPKPYWDKEWLYNEYVTKRRSSQEIASDFGCKDANILYFLRKHHLPIRTVSEAREIKHWGLSGKLNGMHGKTGEANPHWKGGVSPERQALYSSEEWSEAVRVVWKRDAATCKRCGKIKTRSDEFHIHHIMSFAAKEVRAIPENLVLLCKDCHNFVHSKKNVNGEFLNDTQ